MTDGTVGVGGPGARRGGERALAITAVVLSAVLQLVVLVPFTVASGLLAPLWAIVLLHLLWGAAALLLIRVARHRPFAAPLVPVANAAILWLALTTGELWLGWTG